MTAELFRDDAYLQTTTASVVALDGETGVILDRTVFYPLGGGQPGDTGTLARAGGEDLSVIDTRKSDNGIVHVLAQPPEGLAIGDAIEARIDWERRYAHMRMHTGLHLLGAILKFPVTGGSISATRSRLDFDMQDTVDKPEVEQRLNALIEADHAVHTRWITDAELDAQPELVRTMSVSPPRGAGRVRLLDIEGVDLQPCGGTHVRRTAEIGPLRLGKVQKKGARNRRVHIHFRP